MFRISWVSGSGHAFVKMMIFPLMINSHNGLDLVRQDDFHLRCLCCRFPSLGFAGNAVFLYRPIWILSFVSCRDETASWFFAHAMATLASEAIIVWGQLCRCHWNWAKRLHHCLTVSSLFYCPLTLCGGTAEILQLIDSCQRLVVSYFRFDIDVCSH